MNTFGLGLVLSFDDRATGSMSNAYNSLLRLSGAADASTNSISSLENQMSSLSIAGLNLELVGNQVTRIGEAMLSGISGTLQKVAEIGQDFESFKITLGTLYTEEAGSYTKGLEVAEGKLRELMMYSVKTPFDVASTKDLLITLKSQGIDAFDAITNAETGVQEKALDWIGDMMAFKPEIPMQRWKLAIQNFLGEGNSLRLRNILDVGDLKQLIGHELGDTIEERMQSLTDIVSKVGLTGLMEKNMGSMRQVLSNLEDEFQMFYYNIGQAGVFENLTTALNNLNSLFMENQDLIQSFSESIAEGFKLITQPLVPLSEYLRDALITIMEFTSTHPEIAKIGVAFLAIAGSVLVVLGTILKFSGSIFMLSAGLMNIVRLVSIVSGGFAILKGYLATAVVGGLQLALISALIFTAWKRNMFGIQTAVIEVANVIGLCFKAISMSWDGVLTLEEFDWVKKAGLLKLITAVQLIKHYVGEFLSGIEEGFMTFINFWTESVFHIGNVGRTFKDLIDFVSQWIINLDLEETSQMLREVGKAVGFIATVLISGPLALLPLLNRLLMTLKDNISGIDLGGIFQGIRDAFTNLNPDKLLGGIGLMIMAIINPSSLLTLARFLGSVFVNVFSTMFTFAAYMLPSVVRFAQVLGPSLVTAFSDIGTYLFSAVRSLFTSNFATSLFLNIATLFGGIKARVVQEIRMIANTIWLPLKWLGGQFVDLFVIIFEPLGTLIVSIFSKIGTVFTTKVLPIFRLVGGRILTFLTVVGSRISGFFLPIIRTFSSGISILVTRLGAFGTAIGTKLLPILTRFGTVFRTVFGAIGSFLAPIGQILLNFGSTIAPYLSTIGGTFFTGIQTALTYFGGYLMNFLGPTGTVISTILTSIGGWPVLIVGALVALVGLLISSLGDTSEESLQNLTDVFLNAFNMLPDFIKEPLIKISEYISGLVDDILKYFGFTDDIYNVLDGYFTMIWDLFFDIGTRIKNIFSMIIDWVTEAWNGWLGDLVDQVMLFVGKVMKIIFGLQALLEPIILGIIDAILMAVEFLWPVVAEILDLIGGGLANVMEMLNGLLDFIIGVFTGDWDLAWQGLCDLFQGFIDIFVDAWNWLCDVFVEAWESLKILLPYLWEEMWNAIKSAFIWIANLIIDNVNTFITFILNGILSMVNEVVNGLSDGLSDVLSFFGADVDLGHINMQIPTIPHLNTGGFIEEEGMAYLHPSEVVINDPTTKSLQAFLKNFEDKETVGSISNNTVTSISNKETVYNSYDNGTVPSVTIPEVMSNATTNNQSSTTTQDNKVVFNQGSIVIQVNDAKASQSDLESMATQLMRIIERKQSLRAMAIRG